MDIVELSEPAYTAIARVVSTAVGLSIPASRRRIAEQAIASVAERSGVRSAGAYLAGLLDGTVAIDGLVDELVVGETYFLRDPGQFALLRTEIFPELRRRATGGLAIWSAGCATGEEAYSLAIAASESAPEGALDTVLATDVSTRAIAAARAGVYGAWSMRGVAAETIDRIAVRQGASYVVRDRWRQRVEFAHGNLAAESPSMFPAGTHAMDLILCRNVLIYFDEAAVRRAAALLYSALRDGGYLLTAPSDPPLWKLAPFTVMTTDAGIVYRRLRGELPPRWSMTAAADPVRAPAAAAPIASPPRLPCEDVQPAQRLACAAPTALEQAGAAFAAGQWDAAARLTAALDDAPSCLLRVRATANARGTPEAERVCAGAVAKQPTSAELHHVHAVLLLALGRLDDAAAAARRALFLDATLASGHLVLATIARRAGDLALARRSYRNARDLLRDAPDDAPVALADGQRAGGLRRTAEAELASLDLRSPGHLAPAASAGRESRMRGFR